MHKYEHRLGFISEYYCSNVDSFAFELADLYIFSLNLVFWELGVQQHSFLCCLQILLVPCVDR